MWPASLFLSTGCKSFGAGSDLGLRQSLDQITARNIPRAIAGLVITEQSLGSLVLIFGFLTRIADGALFIIFTGAPVVHLPHGWTMNWFGRKNGEGIEYFILLLTLLLIALTRGGGAHSVILWLSAS